MKIQFGILLIGALVVVSGCARKCPPCPVAPASYGSGASYSAPASMPSSGYSNAADSAVSAYGSSPNRYTNK